MSKTLPKGAKNQPVQDSDIVKQILENMSIMALSSGLERNIPAPPPPRPSNESEIKRRVADLLSRFGPGKEIEASFGTFNDKQFIPGVTRQAFLRITELFEFEEPERDTVSISEPLRTLPPNHAYLNYVVRKIEKEGLAPRFELKRRTQIYPNNDYEYRVSESLEVTNVDPRFIKDYVEGTVGFFQKVRKRERTSSIVQDVVRVDLTKIHSGKRFIYEVEVEILDKTSETLEVFFEVVDQIIKAINPPEGLECLPKDRTEATIDLNKLLHPEEKPTTHFIDTNILRPINLTIDDLLMNTFPAITLKLDGSRAFLYTSPTHGAFMFVGGEAVFVAEASANMPVLIIDGEYYEGVLYAFDCIYSGNNIQSLDFKSRYEAMMIGIESIKNVVSVEPKKYYFSDNATQYYTNIQEVYIQCVSDEEKYDGIIFQYLGGYSDKAPRKWKPSNKQTADFKVEAMSGGYKLLVTETMQNGDYKIVPFASVKYPVDILDAPDDIDGRIAEILIKKDDNQMVFEFKKFRDEKSRPNATFTVNDVWRDARRPIDDSTLLGENTTLMRKYFNIEKKKVIDTLFTKLARLGDIGSGQGGDITKWIGASISDVQCFDVNLEMIEEFKRRLAAERPKDTKIQIHHMGFEETGKVLKALRGKTLDGIAAFFSLTFFGSDEQKMDALIETVSKTLRTGSFFTGMVFDGQKVREYMRNKEKVERYKKVIRIDGEFTDKPFGNSVTTNLGYEGETFIKDVKEYLFPFDVFEKKLLDAGFQKVSDGIMDGYPSIPAACQEWVAMNRQFTFVKGEFKSKSSEFSFEELGFAISKSLPGPDSIFSALSKILGELDAKKIRQEISEYPIIEWKKLDGGQLAGGYQQLAMRECSSSIERRKVMEKLNVKKLGPNEYAVLGYDIWHRQISDPSTVIGPRLGVEILSRYLDVGITIYNQLGKVETVYFGQKEVLPKYSRKAHLLYDGVGFSALLPLGVEIENNKVLIPRDQMSKYVGAHRNLANYLRKLDFPYVGFLIPIDLIRDYDDDPVVISNRKEWKIPGQVIPKTVKILQFEKADDLPPYFDSASDPFMEKRRMSCKVVGNPSPLEYWSETPWTLAQKLIELWQNEKRDITVEDAHDALYKVAGVKVCTEFHLSYAMGIMKYLAPKDVDPRKVKVLDPCAGHGARLIAALKLGYSYTACDPDISLRKGHEGIINTFLKSGSPRPVIHYQGAEFVDFGSKVYDMVFTSPPYFDYEIYDESASQSIYGQSGSAADPLYKKDYSQWEKEFLEPMLQHSWAALKHGGYLAIHIQDVSVNKQPIQLVASTRTIADALPGSKFDMIFALRGDSGKDRPVWVWKKN